MLLGAHNSISDGLAGAIKKGESTGCTCIQIFTKNNRQLFANPLKKEIIEEFKNTLKKSKIEVVVAHAGYLINIANPDEKKRNDAIKALIFELERCNALGIPFLVFHPGACLGTKESECIETVSKSIDKVLDSFKGSTKLLLENVAGEGSKIGHSLEQLGSIKNLTKNSKRIGICFDTCHAFAAGYNFCNKKEYIKFWKLFDKTVGIENLKTIHLNDSVEKLGSKKDRHAGIGEGKIGVKAFELIMNDPKLKSIPKILETPKSKSLSEDIKNLETLKKLIRY
ncbi:deoxyribonuclease IV [bacterium]|jgi:deoxyribonuclease IV|nr:deoxyribonuclease IV [bacterium]